MSRIALVLLSLTLTALLGCAATGGAVDDVHPDAGPTALATTPDAKAATVEAIAPPPAVVAGDGGAPPVEVDAAPDAAPGAQPLEAAAPDAAPAPPPPPPTVPDAQAPPPPGPVTSVTCGPRTVHCGAANESFEIAWLDSAGAHQYCGNTSVPRAPCPAGTPCTWQGFQFSGSSICQ